MASGAGADDDNRTAGPATIVKKPTGQRPVENIVGSPVSLRYGGMQPANTARKEMFGDEAAWTFLTRFGAPADQLGPVAETRVFETYPVLTIIALGWTLPAPRPAGRLAKYNPERKKTFSILDWRYVCGLASGAFRDRGLVDIAQWIEDAAQNFSPRKSDQDGLDACLCLLVALYLAEQKECLMVGDRQTGYIVVPYAPGLRAELDARCNRTGRVLSEWVRAFRLRASAPRLSPLFARTWHRACIAILCWRREARADLKPVNSRGFV